MRGVEQSALTAPRTPIVQECQTESGAVSRDLTPSDPDLTRLIDRWPDLSGSVQAEIMQLARAVDVADKHTEAGTATGVSHDEDHPD